MRNYAGKIDGYDVYENIEIGDYNCTVHGYEESEISSDNVEYKWFCVTKVFIEVEVNGKSFYAQASEEFVDMCNTIINDVIADQLKD